jgi:hypothetical protein
MEAVEMRTTKDVTIEISHQLDLNETERITICLEQVPALVKCLEEACAELATQS